MSTTVSEVTQATFDSAVLERSYTVPVVVDFWAAWCGPCRQLSPLLQKYAAIHAGEVDVVKIDVDSNQQLAAQFRVQGIPSVKAIKDGQVHAQFTGLQPEQAIAKFFEALVPSKADRLVAQAQTQAGAQRVVSLEQALDADASHPGAIVALAGIRADEGDIAGATALMERAPYDPAVQRLQAQIGLDQHRVDEGELSVLQQAAARGDGEALVAYGRGLAAAGRHAEAIDQLLSAVEMPESREAAREALVDLFTTLGEDHPLVTEARPKLARALF